MTELKSYLEGRWIRGDGEGQSLVNPTTGEVVATCSTVGLDLERALRFSRGAGGTALRRLTFAERAALLDGIAQVLAGSRDRWFEIARINSGNTTADAAIDVDGAIGTLKYFARLGAGLRDSTLLLDGQPARLSRDPKFQGVHIGVPIKGVAVHINAYNFPAWGLWEKAAVSLLSGVPVCAKPATATAWLAYAMVQTVIESEILPEGSLSLVCGSAHDLLEPLHVGDAVCFTGAAETAHWIRSHPAIVARGVRLNVEADSLNAVILGVDAESGGATFNLFVREVVREMTVKAGQKCTAIRRILVPAGQATHVSDALRTQLERVVVGDPAGADVTMGPLVNMAQRHVVEDGIRSLASGMPVVHHVSRPRLVNADLETGAFVGPTLLRADSDTDARLAHELEVFGPVATLIPYRDASDAFAIAERGMGSLAASVFSSDPTFLRDAAIALGASHGRVLLVDPSVGDSHTGHGIVMPSCVHGGPGRAGGGEELGACRGLWFYHQRLAVQGAEAILSEIATTAATPVS